MQSAQVDVKEYSYFAGNQWRKAADNKVFEVHEPYTGKLFARVAAGSRVDAPTAVDADAKGFAGWAETTPAEKARLFLKAAEIVKRRRSEIAEVLARETGSTISFATFQQDLVAATLHQVAGWVYLPKGEVLETNAPGSHSRQRLYTTSKLANIYFTYALARHLPAGVTANAFDPGMMPGTGLTREAPAPVGFIMKHLLPHAKPLLRRFLTPNVHTVEESGASLARLLTDPTLAGTTGKYFNGREEVRSSVESYDEGRAAELWQASEALTALP